MTDMGRCCDPSLSRERPFFHPPAASVRTSCLAVLLVLTVLTGCDKPAEPAAEVRPVRTLTAQAETRSDLLTQVGEIRPHFESDLGFKIAGKEVSRITELGARVTRGQVVARLDDQDQRNQLLAAQADLVSAKAHLTQATHEEYRQDKLRKDGWSTEVQYDQALQARDSAQATVEAAEARLQLARDQLDYASLRAPEDGVITALGAEAGQVVAAGQMVVRLARLDEKDAVFSIAESLLLNAPHNPLVDVWLLDDKTARTSGRVTELSPSADPVTRTYTVKVALPEAPASMRFGMSVTGQIHLEGRRVIDLPGTALFQQDGQPAVWVVDPVRLTVSLVKVRLLRVDPDRALIADDLADGSLVVTAGVQKLVPGEKVRLLTEAPRPAAAKSEAP